MSRLEAYGISLELPPGWEGSAFRHDGGEPTVHVASFRLPSRDGEFGTRATGIMPRDGLFLAMTEYRVRGGELRAGIFAGRRPRRVVARTLYGRVSISRLASIAFAAASRRSPSLPATT